MRLLLAFDDRPEVLTLARSKSAQRDTELFDFPPTFELVARHVFDRLSPGIAGLAYVELKDKEFNVRTRYLRPVEPRLG